MTEPVIDNPRFEFATVDLVKEAVAPRIEINWEPQTDTGSVCFWVEIEEYVNGEYLRRYPHPHWQMRPMVVTLQELAERGYIVPMPDGETLNVGPLGLPRLVKVCFQDLFALRVTTLGNNAAPVPFAMPEPPAPPQE